MEQENGGSQQQRGREEGITIGGGGLRGARRCNDCV
jgi:hypothetical protein